MLDHVLGRPSPTIRRSQIFLVLFFWLWRLYKGDGRIGGPSSTTSAPGAVPSGRAGSAAGRSRRRGWWWRVWVALVQRRGWRMDWMRRLNERLKHLTPYQIILGTLTFAYALRHLDDLVGVGAPEPLARLYSRSYYRATYVNTALDAGFASAMSIRPKWLKDLCSVLFGFYYLIWATEGDEVLRRFRAICTVEMLRSTWEKTNNPYIRLLTAHHRPSLPLFQKITIPRPPTSSRSHLPPVKGLLFFSGSREQLGKCTELIMDFPGGGFVAMGPECHEERLRRWAKRTGKPVLGIDYGKAPEYPYPYAIEEGFDAYRTLMETRGRCIGIKSSKLGIVLTGDSAGANICTTIMLRILEHPTGVPRPISLILAYPALDFNFTSWMSPANLRVLRTEQSETQIPGLVHGKDHMRHKSPLSVVDDVDESARKKRSRQKGWGEALAGTVHGLASAVSSPIDEKVPAHGTPTSPAGKSPTGGWTRSLPRTMSTKIAGWLAPHPSGGEDEKEAKEDEEETGEDEDEEEDEEETERAKVQDKGKGKDARREADKSLRERVRTPREEKKVELGSRREVVVSSPSPMEAEETLAKGPVTETAKVDKVRRRKKAPIGTRLTMTSRVGYFQDRIISPSMMRAMAILYIGPRRNPDFETDYYISPILSPPHLLAHFPPVYLICGERDPFVDDTVIFAGKIREAKRARRAEAERDVMSNRTARYGEGLRMSTSKSLPGKEGKDDRILRESDDDWVQMRIIEGWGHGFMQMASLMREVEGVLTEMADWIDESFEKARAADKDQKDIEDAMRAASLPAGEAAAAHDFLSPGDAILPPRGAHVKPSREYAHSPSDLPLGKADLGQPVSAPLGSAPHGDDEDTTITFTPKSAQRRNKVPPPSKFTPVPRRPSKEALESLQRSNSAPRFDLDETGSSGEAMSIRTPPLGAKTLPLVEAQPKGTATFAFFSQGSRATPKAVPVPPPPQEGDSNRLAYGFSSPSTASPMTKGPTSSLVAAAVAGARAASPALAAAAGLAPQSVGNVTEAELMRRRRLEAVFGMGMGEEDGEGHSDGEEEGEYV